MKKPAWKGSKSIDEVNNNYQKDKGQRSKGTAPVQSWHDELLVSDVLLSTFTADDSPICSDERSAASTSTSTSTAAAAGASASVTVLDNLRFMVHQDDQRMIDVLLSTLGDVNGVDAAVSVAASTAAAAAKMLAASTTPAAWNPHTPYTPYTHAPTYTDARKQEEQQQRKKKKIVDYSNHCPNSAPDAEQIKNVKKKKW